VTLSSKRHLNLKKALTFCNVETRSALMQFSQLVQSLRFRRKKTVQRSGAMLDLLPNWSSFFVFVACVLQGRIKFLHQRGGLAPRNDRLTARPFLDPPPPRGGVEHDRGMDVDLWAGLVTPL